MDRQIMTTVKNMPSESKYSGYVVARLVDGGLWYWGKWEDYSDAKEVADGFENGMVVGYYVAEGENK